jgi:hypothetical protein
MKTKTLILSAVVFVIFGFAVTACVMKTKEEPKKDNFLNPTESPSEQKRITAGEDAIIHGIHYYIIKVDGQEYLTSTRGGFIELNKK